MAGEHILGGLQRGWAALVRVFPLAGWVTYPPLLLTLAAVLLVVGGGGTLLGIPSLVWHDRWQVQGLAGLSLTALCLHLGMVGFLLDTRDRVPEAQHEPDVGEVARYVIWPCLGLLLAAGIGLVRQPQVRWHGAGVMVVPLLWFVVLVSVLRSQRPVSRLLPPFLIDWARRMMVHQSHKVRWTRDQPVDLAAHAVQTLWMFLLTICYAVTTVLFHLYPAATPAVVAAALALALATGVWGLFSFWLRRYRAVGLVLLVLAVFVTGRTRDVPPHRVERVELTCTEGRYQRLADDRVVLERWRDRLGGRPPLVVVATSGGAARSALWTITVLDALARKIPGFPRHVRLIAGASGGMVGAAHYVAALGPDGTLPLAQVRAGAAADSLGAVTGALLLPGLDRGRALERAWEDSSGGRLAMPFVALSAGEREGWRPSLVFSPMMVEDGRRLIISNLGLEKITETLSPRCVGDEECRSSISAVELLACPGQGLEELPLSTVARMNATFPWVTSAALLPSQPARRVVDAGYYDNYGVDIASLWIRKNADWLAAHTSGVLLVQLRDAKTADTRRDLTVPPGPGYFAGWVSALTTPLEAFLRAREASMSFRNDDEIGLLAADPRLAPSPGFFATALFEFGGEAPLNWYLSEADVAALAVDPPGDTLDRVAAWWAARSR